DDHSVIVEFLADSLPSASLDRRDPILRLALRPKSWGSAPTALFMSELWKVVGTPLPADLASEFLESPRWAEVADERPLELVAPLIPRALSARFVEKFESVARRAALYHRFLLSLPERET